MTVKIKDISSVQQMFGIRSGFGSFANNEIIKNNPALALMLETKEKRSFLKKSKYSKIKLRTDPKFEKLHQKSKITPKFQNNNDNVARSTKEISTNQNHNNSTITSYHWVQKTKKRFYNIYLQPTLFGNFSIIKSWGSLYNRLGKCKIIFFDNMKEAESEIKKINNQRKRRRYLCCG